MRVSAVTDGLSNENDFTEVSDAVNTCYTWMEFKVDLLIGWPCHLATKSYYFQSKLSSVKILENVPVLIKEKPMLGDCLLIISHIYDDCWVLMPWNVFCPFPFYLLTQECLMHAVQNCKHNSKNFLSLSWCIMDSCNLQTAVIKFVLALTVSRSCGYLAWPCYMYPLFFED